ncbi:MAG: glycosyltransferase family A protein [Opitutaceae bacterium]|nr:glycosyltransferase family A protein [Opitutaceae bacterium]
MISPFVSIIIPCHNAAPWLAETLESALTQTWPAKEIILIDDGSTDESQVVARSYEPRGVRVLTQANQGASAARNRAFRESRGDFIQFLDADDLISPNKIALQAAALTGAPDGRVASCAWGRFRDDPTRAVFVDEAVYRDFAPIEFLLLGGDAGRMIHPSAWLTPRETAERAGPWNEELTLNDDGEFFSRVLLASTGITFTPTARSYYRSGLPGSLSQRRDERSRRSQFRSIELIAEHLRQAEDSPRVLRAIANHYQRFVYDFYPFPADLMELAEQRVAALGGSTLALSMGPKTAALARLLGWRRVWRFKHWWRSHV